MLFIFFIILTLSHLSYIRNNDSSQIIGLNLYDKNYVPTGDYEIENIIMNISSRYTKRLDQVYIIIII